MKSIIYIKYCFHFEIKMKTLVLSGGGLKGIAILGLLQKLYKTGKLNNFDKFIGTSVGSIISLLLSIGYTPLEIYEMYNKINYDFSSICHIDNHPHTFFFCHNFATKGTP